MKYHIITVATFGIGAVLGLSPEQAMARRANLTPAAGRDGWYVATAPVQFKVGESVLHDTDLPKFMANLVESDEVPHDKSRRGQRTKQRKQVDVSK